jgi:hypothetical protein
LGEKNKDERFRKDRYGGICENKEDMIFSSDIQVDKHMGNATTSTTLYRPDELVEPETELYYID